MLRFLVNRPVAVLLSAFGLALLGVVAATKLPVSLLPEVPIPIITVHIHCPNASASMLENTVTRLLRHQLVQVGRLKDIQSQTRNGSATITLEFEYGANTNLAFMEVNEKIDYAANSLPKDMERPMVLKANLADIPVFYLSVFPKNKPGALATPDRDAALELAGLARNTLRRRLEQLPEVAFADMSGFAEPEIVVSPKTGVFQSLRLTENDLENILRDANLDLGSLLVQDGHYQYHVRFRSALQSVEDIAEIRFRHGGQVLQLKEVAEVRLQTRQRRGLYLFNGQEAIAFRVHKKPDARLFDLKKSFEKLLAELRQDFPQLNFAVSHDQSELLDVSIRSLRSNLAWGAFFAIAVLFLFFREWRSPLLIGIVVPVSLVTTLLGFYFANTSINVISLSGLILGAGLMIDNAIIILENIRQYQRLGYGLTDACVLGTKEVVAPLVSSAATTCSVFLPLVFLGGVGGALFEDQAWSVTLALGVSLVVACFLLPVLLNLGKKDAPPPDSIQEKSVGLYERTVERALKKPWTTMGIFTLWSAGAIWAGSFLPKETFPKLTRQGIVAHVDWNEATSVETARRRLEALLANLGENVHSSGFFIGETQFLLERREQGMHEASLFLFGEPALLAERARHFFKQQHPAAVVGIEPVKNLFDEVFGSRQAPLIAHLQPVASSVTPALQDIAPIVEMLEKQGITATVPPTEEQIEVEISREEALRYDVPYQALYDKLRSLFGQHGIGHLHISGGAIPILSSEAALDLQTRLRQAQVRNRRGDDLPLAAFVQLHKTRAFKTLTAGKSGESLELRFPVFRKNLPGDLREAVVKDGKFSVRFSGQVFENERIVRELTLIGGVSLMLLYLILAAQFESLRLPFIVLLTIPVGVAGSLLALLLAGQSLDVVSLTGIIVMSGVVVNDSILKVDMMNRLSKTMPLKASIREAGQRRLRPILMTTVTTILALLPGLFASGLGADLQQPLIWAVLGGLTVGTAASLYFIPVIYFLLEGVRAGRTPSAAR
jgi:multidrug efflux pump subunit AcrB